MHISTLVLLVVTPSCLSIAGALPASCKPEWKIDWYQQFPDVSNFDESFSYPGEIFPGMSFKDIIQFVGLSWNAPSWQEVMGRVCIQFGPLLNVLYPEVQIRKNCDLIITSLKKGERSDIYGMCTSFWKKTGIKYVARSVKISRYPEYLGRFGIPFIDFLSKEIDRPDDVIVIDRIITASRIAFHLLDWLGPSPFPGGLFGTCLAVRFLLSNTLDKIGNEVKTLLTNLAAQTLQYLNIMNVCTSGDEITMDVLYILPISKQDDEYICDFLSGDPSLEEYFEKGAALVNTLLSVPSDVDLCTDVIGFLSAYDEFGATGYLITKRNLKSRSNRQQLCHEIASALSDNTQTYTYSFPADHDIENWHVFARAGQLLPDFSFLDAVNVLGAFLRSSTLLDGCVVLCDIFESFFSQEFDPSVKGICKALRNGDTATVEKRCRKMSLLAKYFHTPLINSTAAYLTVTAIDMERKLLDLQAISPGHICSAWDRFFHSKNNLQSVIRFGLNVYLAELLPIADSICKDYHSVFDYIEERMDPFDFLILELSVREWNDVILTHLGFSDQKQICQSIAAGIDTFSGRAKRSLTKNMEDRVLKFLTDTERCIASFKSLQRLYTTISSHDDFYHDFIQYTGYLGITRLCETVSVMFGPERCKDASHENISSHSKDSSNEKLSSHCSWKNPFDPEIDVCMKVNP